MGNSSTKNGGATSGVSASSGTGVRKTRKALSVKDKAVLDLKVARDRLDKARKLHETQVDIYRAKAKDLLAAKKLEQAKLALKLKKMRDNQLEKLNAQLVNLDQLVSGVEWAQFQVEIVEGMKAGNAALKELHIDASDLDDIMLDTQEALTHQRELNGIISESLNPEDEAAVLLELEELDAADSKKLAAELPEAPSSKPVVVDSAATAVTAADTRVQEQPILS